MSILTLSNTDHCLVNLLHPCG